jgi:hypothetical protein
VCCSVDASFLGQAHHEGSHLRSEQRLLGGDELRRGEVAGERVRRRVAAQVQRHRHADREHPDRLEHVAARG